MPNANEFETKKELITRYLNQAKEKNLLYSQKTLSEWLEALKPANTYDINTVFKGFFEDQKLITLEAVKRKLKIIDYKPVNTSCHRTVDEIKNAPKGIKFNEYLENLANEEPSDNPTNPDQRTPEQYRQTLIGVMKMLINSNSFEKAPEKLRVKLISLKREIQASKKLSLQEIRILQQQKEVFLAAIARYKTKSDLDRMKFKPDFLKLEKKLERINSLLDKKNGTLSSSNTKIET